MELRRSRRDLKAASAWSWTRRAGPLRRGHHPPPDTHHPRRDGRRLAAGDGPRVGTRPRIEGAGHGRRGPTSGSARDPDVRRKAEAVRRGRRRSVRRSASASSPTYRRTCGRSRTPTPTSRAVLDSSHGLGRASPSTARHSLDLTPMRRLSRTSCGHAAQSTRRHRLSRPLPCSRGGRLCCPVRSPRLPPRRRRVHGVRPARHRPPDRPLCPLSGLRAAVRPSPRLLRPLPDGPPGQ